MPTPLSTRDFSAALSVSFLSVVAGSAFGLWTGVGAQAGILSMALASIFGGFFGGLAIKTSGPTGSTAAVMFAAMASVAMVMAEVGSTALMALCLAAASMLVFALSFLPVHRLLESIPHIGVAVFINGVATLLLWKQGQKLWELGKLDAPQWIWEVGLALGSLVLLTVWSKIIPRLKKIPGSRIVSGSLLAMILGALLVFLFDPQVQTLPSTALSFATLLPDFSGLKSVSFPVGALIATTLKIAATVAFVTLVTSRALSVASRDDYGRELRNQGVANLAVAAIGGIPVTIGFIRTRILQRGGAASPLVGALVGVFILLILLLLQPALVRIPTAVFIGILLRAGLVSYDLQVWTQFRNHPATGWFPLLFVAVGSVASVIFDPMTVLAVSVVAWKILERFQLTRPSFHDISDCPKMA